MERLTREQIQAKRQALNWTQRALADRLKVAPASVSKWEAGLTEPSFDHMRDLIEVFEQGDVRQSSRLDELEAEVIRLRADLVAAVGRIETLAELVARDLGRQLSHPEAATPPDRADVAAQRRAPRSG